MNAIDSAAASADHDALDAIRRGDKERYRELIERYERQVYAVAWSRLGDAELARDATQDAFIKAYRHLGSLREGSRFGAWITAIVRSISINLGIRHRKELKRRERWQLEHQHPETTDCETVDPMSGESLRSALESLPPIHRECLVLFYLEGKSVAESATALGLSEGTFKTRLHRARAALRDRMEELLEDGLEQLRPPSNLVHSIMLALPATSGIGIAGGGAGATLAKLLPGGFMTLAIPLIGVATGVLTGWWLHRKERENFRDPNDFRVRSHLSQAKRMAVFIGIVMVFSHVAGRAVSFPHLILWLMPFLAVTLGVSLRSLRINRSPFAVANAVCLTGMMGVFAAVAFFGAPFQIIIAGSAFAALPAVFFRKGLPHTHDYSLFLRNAHGLLRPSPLPVPVRPRSVAQLFEFARVLGPRWVAVGYRKGPDFLRLILPGVRFSPMDWLMSVGRRRSSVTLWTDGKVAAHLSVPDAHALVADGLPVSRDFLEEESAVAQAVQTALAAFDRNDTAGIESSLGQVPDDTLFKVAPERAGGLRSARGILIVSLLILLGVSQWGFWRISQSSNRTPIHLRNAVPVHLTAAEFQRQTGTGKILFHWKTNQIDLLAQAVWQNVVLPPRSWWTDDALQSVVTNAITRLPLLAQGTAQAASDQMVVSSLLSQPSFSTLLDAGLLTTKQLAELGYTSDACRRGLKALAGSDPKRWPASRLRFEVQGVVGETYTVLSSDSLVATLNLFAHLDCLSAIDPDPIIQVLQTSQVLTNTSQPDRRPLPDRPAWDGLFLLKGYNPLEETWQALSILERLHSVDSIDRAACIGGTLRFHLGEGRFGVRGNAGLTNGIYFNTPAKDTFYAYESLRILGALDRAQDLPKWKFLVVPNSLPPDPEPGATLDLPARWEAGVLQDRFEHLVEDLQAGRPARSLTDPTLSTPFVP